MEKLFQIDMGPGAPCAGGEIIQQNEIWRCRMAAPVIHYMIGWTEWSIRKRCHLKGWKFTVVGEKNANS